MKTKIALLIVGAGAGGGLVTGCGSDHTSAAMQPNPPPTIMTMDLDTAAVLAIVQTKTSETASPFQVDNGEVAVTPAGDETSAPLDVDST
jgi:hypothetical protein